MKRKNILIILWILWIASMIGMAFGVCSYIDKKRTKLSLEIRDELLSIFEGQSDGDAIITIGDGFFDANYSGSPVRHYKKVPIFNGGKYSSKFLSSRRGAIIDIDDMDLDEKEKERLNNEAHESWEHSYGDLASLYELNWNDQYPNNEDNGWCLAKICYVGDDDNFIRTCLVFPYKVGLKKTNYGNYYTVQQAVDEAFEFYTTDPKSPFSDRFIKGSYHKIWNKIYESSNRNEYFNIVETSCDAYQGSPICYPDSMSDDEIERTMPIEYGWMHNGYFRVFIAATKGEQYSLKEDKMAVAENRNRLLMWWGIGITVLFMSIIIPLTIREKKANKIKSETLYQRLCRMCNPSNFMKDYNREKVDKANEIYQRLMAISPDDKEALMSLQAEAVADLGIVIIDAEKLEDLTKKVNPQRFMKPYNAEKVKIANNLYSRLTKDGLTYEEFAQIEEESQKLDDSSPEKTDVV